jgi:hypothetical protein
MPRPRGDEPPVEEVDPVAEAQAALAEQRRVDAFARLRSLLNRYDLGALEGNVRDLIARGITDGERRTVRIAGN